MMEVTVIKNELEEEIEHKESLIENLLKNELVKILVFFSFQFIFISFKNILLACDHTY